jgi:hypothetical protein
VTVTKAPSSEVAPAVAVRLVAAVPVGDVIVDAEAVPAKAIKAAAATASSPSILTYFMWFSPFSSAIALIDWTEQEGASSFEVRKTLRDSPTAAGR